MRLKPAILGFFAALALSAQAGQFIATNAYVVAADQTIADEQWVQANTAETKGTFENDLFIASGGRLVLDGIYEGNLWGAAGTEVLVGGKCLRNVRLTGQTVRINGAVEGNLTVLANTIVLGTNAMVGGHARLIGASIVNEGTIGGNATITAARVATLGGTIEGNAKVVAMEEIILPDDARIHGDLAYTASKELIPVDGVVDGRLERIVPSRPPFFDAARLQPQALWFVAAFLAGVPFIALFPMTTAMASLLARKSPLKCLLIGFVVSAALPAFAVSCIGSMIGIPLGALLLAAWGALAYLGRIVTGLMIGTLILRSPGTSIGRVLLAMAAGLAAFHIAILFPAISLPVQLAAIWMGMGALLLALVRKRRLIMQVPEEPKHLGALKGKQDKPTEESP